MFSRLPREPWTEKRTDLSLWPGRDMLGEAVEEVRHAGRRRNKAFWDGMRAVLVEWFSTNN